MSFAAMSCELELRTLQGGVITLEVSMETTLGELKTMILEKHTRAEDVVERKLLRVELLLNSSIIEMDDAQTLGAAGLLEAEAPTTVIYRRNEAEASTKDDVHALGFFHLNTPSTCTTISRSAFDSCQNLVSVTITGSVTHIGDCAFSRCTSLASVTLGESVTHIGMWAFKGCTSLASVTLGESVTHIGISAFRGCAALASVTLGESVTHIGDCAFSHCTSLASVTLGESVAHIGVCAFGGCTSLASVPSIQEGTFHGCISLASFIVGDSATRIENTADHSQKVRG